MSFPNTTVTNGTDAMSLLVGKASAAGIVEPTGGLNQVDFIAYVLGNLLVDSPPAQNLVTTGPVTGGSLNIGGSGAAASDRSLTKTVTGLSDTVATDVLTVTIPNTKQNAVLRVTLLGSLGAGGAIGAGEAAHAISYDFSFVRTAGVAAVSLISTAYGSTKQAVAGAATVTTAGAVSAVTGGVTVANTFTITCAITKSGGSSDNHVAVVRAELLNAFGTGITVA